MDLVQSKFPLDNERILMYLLDKFDLQIDLTLELNRFALYWFHKRVGWYDILNSINIGVKYDLVDAVLNFERISGQELCSEYTERLEYLINLNKDKIIVDNLS